MNPPWCTFALDCQHRKCIEDKEHMCGHNKQSERLEEYNAKIRRMQNPEYKEYLRKRSYEKER